jgi:hypothetical protein
MVGWEPFLYFWSAGQQITKTISETVTISETKDRVKTTSREPGVPESVFVSEGTVVISKQYGRILVETVTTEFPSLSFHHISFTTLSFGVAIEEILRVKGINRSLTAETTVIAESLARRKGDIQSLGIEVPEPAIPISEATALLRHKVRTVTTNQSFTDLSFTITGFDFERGNVEISDLAVAHKVSVPTRSVSDTVTIGEQVARLGAKIKALATQTTALSESSVSIRNKIRQIADISAESSDAVDLEVTTLAKVRSLEESETIADDIGTELAKVRQVEEITAITDSLQGFVNNVPLQVEEHPAPPSSLISGERRIELRPYQRRPRIQLEEEPHRAIAPLRILASLGNRLISHIQPQLQISNSIQISRLQIRDTSKGVARTSLLTISHPNKIKQSLRLSQKPQLLKASLKLSDMPTQQALEPRKIINIEKGYKTLQLYDLLLILDSIP